MSWLFFPHKYKEIFTYVQSIDFNYQVYAG